MNRKIIVPDLPEGDYTQTELIAFMLIELKAIRKLLKEQEK